MIIDKNTPGVEKTGSGYQFNGDIITQDELNIKIPLIVTGNIDVDGNFDVDENVDVKGVIYVNGDI